jgi:hypothetical protein
MVHSVCSRRLALRQACYRWRLERDDNDSASGQPHEDAPIVGESTYAGSDRQTEVDTWLADAARQHQQNRRIAWDERPCPRCPTGRARPAQSIDELRAAP